MNFSFLTILYSFYGHLSFQPSDSNACVYAIVSKASIVKDIDNAQCSISLGRGVTKSYGLSDGSTMLTEALKRHLYHILPFDFIKKPTNLV